MSNYIMLIMYAYNEKEECDDRFRPKINVSNYFKENKKVSALLIITTILGLSCVVLPFINIKYSLILFIAYIICILILIPMSEKQFQKSYKRNIEKYDLRLEILRSILREEFKLYETKKIEELIKQCEISIKAYKLSTKIFRPLSSMINSVIFPIITFSLGLISKNAEISVNVTIKTTILVVSAMLILLGLFYCIKNPIESFLDSDSNKIKKLKGMLNDIIIKDFFKDENKKSNFELYNSGNN